jgi:hypothetical protein
MSCANELDLRTDWALLGGEMAVPKIPATLTAEQLTELNSKLGHMRHEINNQLAMVVAALEMIRFRPDMRDKMLATISQQPPMIMAEVAKFTAEFEQAFGISRG